jgi:hypothetical protein
MKDAIILAGSAAVVVLLIAMAWALGFRGRASLDRDALVRLAAAEGLDVREVLIASDARAALALLSGGNVLLARVMGLDISARFAPLDGVQLRAGKGMLTASIADLGYAPLHIKGVDAPDWLQERLAPVR